VAGDGTDANGTSAPPARWYPDPEHAGWQRYWDGTAWTDHRAPILQSADLKPGLVGVWISAILSIFTFSFFSTGNGDTTSIAIPLGVISMFICLHLVRRARDDARRRGLDLPMPYKAARVTAIVLASLSVLSSIVTTFG
jgi:hypothetical protein